MRLATYASVSVAVGLVVIKLAAWLLTGSVAMLSSFMDSALDMLASLINVFAVRHALQPADAEHRFGHGKAEAIAGLAQSAFVTGSAVLLVAEAAPRLFVPEAVQQELFGVAIMGVSVAATGSLVAFQRMVIRRSQSVAIAADASHYMGDLMLNIAVIVALLLNRWVRLPWIDPLFAIGIAAYLVRNAWHIARESLDALMDREFPDADRDKILALASGQPQVLNAHDLRTRSSGLTQFIQLHLVLDRDLSLFEAHAIGDRVENDIRRAFPKADVIIHHDPSGVYDSAPRFDDAAKTGL